MEVNGLGYAVMMVTLSDLEVSPSASACRSGRHNAFDKLIGAMLRDGSFWGEGFALLSSRCSYELVEKAALAGCSTLVTVSAATSLAVERANEAGIRLLSLARSDSFLAA